MSILYNRAVALYVELQALDAIPAVNYQEKLIRAYEQKSLDEFLRCFASDKTLDKNAMSVFLENNRVRTHSTCVSAYARAESELTKIMCLARYELDDNAMTTSPPDLSGIIDDFDIDLPDYSSALVNWLGEAIALENKDDLVLFLCLSEENVRLMFAANTHIAASFVTQHATMNDVVNLLNSTHNSGCTRYLLDYLFCQNPELFTLDHMCSSFALLDDDKIMLFAKWCIQKVLTNLSVLKEEFNTSCTLLLKSVLERLPDLINDARQLVEVLLWLPNEHRGIVLELIRNKLPRLITDVEQLMDVFLLVPEEFYELVLNLISARLPHFIVNAEQLTDVFLLLPEHLYGLVIELLRDSLPGLINNIEQLREILIWVPKELRGLVISSISARLSGFISCPEQLTAVLQMSPEEQCAQIIEQMRYRLSDLITDAEQLMNLLTCCPEQERRLIIECVEDRLPELITDIEQFKECILWLPQEYRIRIIDFMQDRLPELITNIEQLNDCFLWLSEEQWIQVIAAVQCRLSDWIMNTEDFVGFLETCPKEGRGLVVESVRTKLPILITNTICLLDVLKSCPKESRGLVSESVQNQLPNLITSAKQLVSVLKLVPSTHRQLVIESVQSMLPKLLGNLEQLILVLNAVSESLRPIIINSMAKIPNVLDNILTNERVLDDTNNESHLLAMLEQLGNKSLDLARDGATNKAYAALSLYDGINKTLKHYQQSQKTRIDYNLFYNESAALIEKAKNSDLKRHRGWSELLINLLIGVVSLGVAFIVNKMSTGGRCTFFSVGTDSVRKVNELSNALSAVVMPSS